MNSLHGIKLANDTAAVRGRLLEYNEHTGLLYLGGDPLTPTFLSRDAAARWAALRGATLAGLKEK